MCLINTFQINEGDLKLTLAKTKGWKPGLSRKKAFVFFANPFHKIPIYSVQV